MKTRLLFVLIILLALLLRVWRIDLFPVALYGDEQAFAWNAFNILKLGQDEYGSPYPLQFRSFEDYKAPIPVYLLVPFIKIFGLTPFAVRIPIVLASTATVIATYFLVRKFLNKKISLLITFFFAISPWHIHLSRGFFEATLSLLFFVLGIYFFLRSSRDIKRMLISMLFFTLSLYSYFTPRILLLFFLPFLFIYEGLFSAQIHQITSVERKKLFFRYGISFSLFLILCLPLIQSTFFGEGFSRFQKLSESVNKIVVETVRIERSSSLLQEPWRNLLHNKLTVQFRLFTNNYFEHFSTNFWYVYGDNSLRYFLGNMGMFHIFELPFFIAGLYWLWKDKRKVALFFLGWLILAPIPASFVGRPFAVRSLAMLPAPFVFVAYGIYKLLRYSGVAKRLLPGVVTLGFIISVGSLLVRYYLEYPIYAATWWGWENKAAIDYAKANESQYDRVFISNFYTGASLAFAVYTQYDPLAYRYAINHPIIMADGRHLVKLGKYYFGSLDIDEKRLGMNIIPPKSLYIARPEEVDSKEVIIAPGDGRVIFKIYKTN